MLTICRLNTTKSGHLLCVGLHFWVDQEAHEMEVIVTRNYIHNARSSHVLAVDSCAWHCSTTEEGRVRDAAGEHTVGTPSYLQVAMLLPRVDKIYHILSQDEGSRNGTHVGHLPCVMDERVRLGHQ
jgi:hypothetical protein